MLVSLLLLLQGYQPLGRAPTAGTARSLAVCTEEPSPASMRRVQARFGELLDARHDAAIRPLLSKAQPAEERQSRTVGEKPQRQPRVQQRRPDMLTRPAATRRVSVAERLDALADAALAPALMEQEPAARTLRETRGAGRRAADRVAVWLEKRYVEVYGPMNNATTQDEPGVREPQKR